MLNYTFINCCEKLEDFVVDFLLLFADFYPRRFLLSIALNLAHQQSKPTKNLQNIAPTLSNPIRHKNIEVDIVRKSHDLEKVSKLFLIEIIKSSLRGKLLIKEFENSFECVLIPKVQTLLCEPVFILGVNLLCVLQEIVDDLDIFLVVGLRDVLFLYDALELPSVSS